MHSPCLESRNRTRFAVSSAVPSLAGGLHRGELSSNLIGHPPGVDRARVMTFARNPR